MTGRRRSERVLRDRLRSLGRPRCSVAGASATVLDVDRRGALERGRVDEGWSITASRVLWFRAAGGMAPSHLSRSSKPSSGRYLSFVEREEIALLRAEGLGVREVAGRMGRAPSTISRQLRRNAATRGGNLDYRATTAQWHAERAACRPKAAKLATNLALRSYVQDRLAGAILPAGGAAVAGPAVPWKSRRHRRRRNRRWGLAWGPPPNVRTGQSRPQRRVSLLPPRGR